MDNMDFFNKFNNTVTRTINKNLLLELLNDLNSKLKANSISLDLNLYGGSAMLLLYDARPSTCDLDCIINSTTDIKIFNNIIHSMAETYNLANDWINSDVSEPLKNIKSEDLLSILTFSNISICVPAAEQLLAMKLLSARPEPSKDFIDCYLLCKDLDVNSYRELIDIFSQYFNLSLVGERQKMFMKYLCEDLNNGE